MSFWCFICYLSFCLVQYQLYSFVVKMQGYLLLETQLLKEIVPTVGLFGLDASCANDRVFFLRVEGG